jgi:3-oxoacyl-[acyl-carrier-protein] synthase-3
MKYTRVFLEALGYELAPIVVTSSELETELKPMYEALHIAEGQLEALTGIIERRWWEPGYALSQGATAAARKALARSAVQPDDLEILIYAGVCRENFEPATACRVAANLGMSGAAAVYDLSNACLGVLNGILEIANRIELGQIRAGLVVSCETAREITQTMIERMLRLRDIEMFKDALATLTGGSGAAAVLLTDGSFGHTRRRLLGGVTQTAPQFHGLCRWGVDKDPTSPWWQVMITDAVGVLQHGVALGAQTWQAFLQELGWTPEQVDKIICHQVGSTHRDTILQTLRISESKDFSTHAYLGNIGTVSLPLTAGLAEDRDFLEPGDRVGFLGIGSGLNCLMLGWEW